MEMARRYKGSASLNLPWDLPNTTVHLIGTTNGKSGKISDWRQTDANGALNAGGAFDAGTEGDSTLRVDIGGLLSNTISFTVSNCT